MSIKPSVDPCLIALGLVFSLTPSAFAQTLSPDFAKAAQDACVSLAASKGFALTEVVSVGPKAETADEATVVLSLDRAGEPYKLTCGYTTAGGVTTSADQAAEQENSNPVLQAVSNLVTQATSTFTGQPESSSTEAGAEPAAETAPAPAAPAPAAAAEIAPAPIAPDPAAQTAQAPALPDPAVSDPAAQTAPATAEVMDDPSSDFVTNTTADSVAVYAMPNLWWLLLPLIGMPLLLFWVSQRGGARTETAVTDTDHLEAIVQSSDQLVKIFSHPNAPDDVIGTLNDGELVLLSGRQNDGWAELASGGWVPTHYLNLEAKYSIR